MQAKYELNENGKEVNTAKATSEQRRREKKERASMNVIIKRMSLPEDKMW